ncbi:MAG: zinc-dependent metalloprotease [Pseudomonadota bacterium]
MNGAYGQNLERLCRPEINTPIAQCLDKHEIERTTEGLFTLHKVANSELIFMEIAENQLDREFILFSYVENGIDGLGFSPVGRGDYRRAQIIKFQLYNNNIDVTFVQSRFSFSPASPLARSQEAFIRPSIVESLSIIRLSKDDNGDARYLIELSEIFDSQTFETVLSRSVSGFSRPSDFRVAAIRGYERNSDFVIDYLFRSNSPSRRPAVGALGDSRAFSIRMQHTILAAPDEAFAPYMADPRVGYFTEDILDLTGANGPALRHNITRWRLTPKDPSQSLSEPVKPIKFWIENTTPYQFREAVKKGVLAWNSAFEQAGFINAVEVSVQPDEAEWDAGDIDKNVIRWISSPFVYFQGMGPSFTDPRTGEILGADLIINYAAFASLIGGAEPTLPETPIASLARQAHDNDEGKGPYRHQHGPQCWADAYLSTAYNFAFRSANVLNLDDSEKDRLIEEALVNLVMHEVGHALGLTHNFRGSAWRSADDIHDPKITDGAPIASVMDYAAANVAPIGVAQGDYFNTKPGPYDHWAIEFGYRAALSDPDAEADKRKAILARSLEPALQFSQWPSVYMPSASEETRSFDPRANVWDMSSDPVAYATDRIELVDAFIRDLANQHADDADYRSFGNALSAFQDERRSSIMVVARQIGGEYYNNVSPGDAARTGVAAIESVPKDKQKEALSMLDKYLFSAEASRLPFGVFKDVPIYDYYGAIAGRRSLSRAAINEQRSVLSDLTWRYALNAMADASLDGSGYEPSELLRDLDEILIGSDLGPLGNPDEQRRALQRHYVERLIELSTDDYQAGAAARIELSRMRARLQWRYFWLSADVKAHRAALRAKIDAEPTRPTYRYTPLPF